MTLHPRSSLPPNTPLSPLDSASEDSYSFHFTAGSSAVSDREHFKKEITSIIAANREREANAALGVEPPSSAVEGTEGKGKKRAVDRSSNGKGSDGVNSRTATTDTSSSAAADFRLRKLVLQANPNLMALHRELVMSGQIAEVEFWEGREDLLEQARASEAQLRGKSGAMVDLRPETSQTGEVTVKITPTQIADIFAEYPMVLKAYNENVPDPLNDQEFWTRYFQSKLFNRNRTTNRSAVASVKDDAIFDKYLGEEDDDIEPKNLQHHEIYRLLDLAATEEDQHEVDIQPDITMRPGRERAALPLMRRFNEHSERLLNQSLGNTVDRSRISFDPGNAGDRNYYEDILLDDLIDHTSTDRIELNLTEKRNRLTAASSANLEDDEGQMMLDGLEREEVVRRIKEEMQVWEPRIDEFEPSAEAINESMRDMTSSILQKVERSSRDSQSSSGAIPRAILDQCTTIAASSNEFLRQFWSSVLPPKPGDLSASALSTPVQKAAKAERMKNGLDKTIDRMNKVLNSIENEGIRLRVEAALLPVRESVETAIKFFNDRTNGTK